jgi:signal transduction histidine kinase
MKSATTASGVKTRLIPASALLVGLVIPLFASAVLAQQPSTPKRVLVLDWYDKDYPWNLKFDQAFHIALQNAPQGSVEYYVEYLDSNRFPGENQSLLLRDYLRRKYADRSIDVLVANSDASLDFLLKYRDYLFPDIPIVFVAVRHHLREQLAGTVNLTGIINLNAHRKTLDLALRLHPHTEQVFVITGTLERDKRLEIRAREELQGLESRVQLNYLTDLSLEELLANMKSLPPRSIVLHVWQQSRNEEGKILESADMLALIARSSTVPIYAMALQRTWSLHADELAGGSGIVGGYSSTPEACAARMAEIAVRIAKGERAQDIAIENAPTVAMFDWRELRRWGISEDELPPGSIIRFKELTFWQQNKSRIIGVLALIGVQASLITILLIERRRRQRARASLDRLNAELERRVARRTAALAAKTRELETFSYSVAHDLKAPLRGIDGYVRLLIQDYSDKLDDEGRSFLETIQSSSEDMSQLIEDLLAYSHLEGRKMKPYRLELFPIVEAVVEQKRHETAGRSIEFIVEVNGGSVIADGNGLTQALRNYVDNAIKFTRDAENPRIEIGSAETMKSCRLWVRDNGVGFDMKYHERIFDMFQRLHGEEEFTGTGVGLAIVRKAMERIGGRAWAESEPGKGSTFYLEIPK